MNKQKWQREYTRRYREKAKPAYDALMSCYPFTLDDLDGEEWKPIVDYENYHVSTYGRVKSFKGDTPIIRKPKLKNGYLSVGLNIDGKQKWVNIHQLVARAFIPNVENKPQVNHIDGQKLNCHVSNLEWATQSENIQHALRTGLKKSGTDNYNAKIKDEETILYIRENPDGLTTYQLADKFGVTVETIRQIQRGKTHKNSGGIVREKQKRGWYRRVPDEIRDKIRADYVTGNYTQTQLARKYGVSQSTIRNIIAETGFAPSQSN